MVSDGRRCPMRPQFGTGILVEVNDRRTLDAVWRNNQLYATTTINPNAGIDAGHTTAHWWRLDTTGGIGALFTADQGNVGAEDLGADTYTFFPVRRRGQVRQHGHRVRRIQRERSTPGAYYTGRFSSDAPGTVQPTGVLQAGTDYYYRAFGGPRNRWGDYSGMAIDPDDVTFWVYNEHAMTRGTVFATLPAEDGRWDTHWGAFDLSCNVVSVAITGFEARPFDGGVELSASFNAEFDDFRVNIYRQDDVAAAAGALQDHRDERPHRHDVCGPRRRAGQELPVLHRRRRPRRRVLLAGHEGPPCRRSPRSCWQNTPNPFNPTTTIAFTLPQSQHVSLVIYDAAGRVVKTLADGITGFGTHNMVWDGTDNTGNQVGSGIYFYRLETGSFIESKKMVLIK